MPDKLLRIDNTPRPYPWGVTDGIADLLGRPRTGAVEAELWLGSHPGSPSRVLGPAPWPDLAAWEEYADRPLPFLLKVLAADRPLSLQAHPTAAQAAAGFAREDAAGIPVDDPGRNYPDPRAKPELIVAARDGFEALCGFREVAESLATLDALAPQAAGRGGLGRWRELLAADGLRACLAWLLSGSGEITEMLDELPAGRSALLDRLRAAYPGDPGVAVALLLNHVVLAAGEALYLPAGNIHTYLRGVGVELMGPSDNVLRGGLTAKHVDRAELLAILDLRSGPPQPLTPYRLGPNARSYRPRRHPAGRDVDFELVEVSGPIELTTTSAAVLLVLDGGFTADAGGERLEIGRGQAALVAGPDAVGLTGRGRLYLAATGVRPRPPVSS
ncbi:MAG: mannose-6-phosphate isomerase, class I [Nocardioides sp.]|uniref:mannose-6-phosphate isomerase, class I n=1 Tax=Nocardioides sp. TaxID=35761 RepID=UPI0039E61435